MAETPNQTPVSNAVHIRTRPGMYIGGINERGLASLLSSTIEDELDLAGDRLSNVKVTLKPDEIYEVEFIGDIADIQPVNFIDFIRFENGGFGIDLPVLAAMSDPLDVEVIRDGQRWRQQFIAGVAIETPLRDRVDLPSALRLKYRPDPVLFKNLSLPAFRFIGQIQEFAIFRPHLIFEIDDRRTGFSSRRFHYPLGLRDYIHELEYDLIHLGEISFPLHLEICEGSNRAQAILLPTHFATRVIRSYLNRHRLPGGGPHVKAFESAFQKIAREFEDREGYPFCRHDDEDPLYGLTVLFSFDLAKPDYFYSNRSRLDGDLSAKLVTRMVNEQLPPLLKQKTAQLRE